MSPLELIVQLMDDEEIEGGVEGAPEGEGEEGENAEEEIESALPDLDKAEVEAAERAQMEPSPVMTHPATQERIQRLRTDENVEMKLTPLILPQSNCS